ncbi:MAG: transposase, partial [Nitrospirae bacterium]|nr:transposase [Nitrospirota bacterium]
MPIKSLSSTFYATLAQDCSHKQSPTLRPGDVVIMDNLSSHKSKNVEEAIKARGAKLAFSPPYSPELSPIEYYWSKMKKYLK